MFFVLTGSSCAGKSTVARLLRVERLEIHDSDEDGVPSDADAAWRQQDLERWVERALVLSRQRSDLLLTGQSPLGEVLATPSAPLLDGIAVALLDVADDERRRRLDERDGDRWTPQQRRDLLGWGRWHRSHAADPSSVPEVLIDAGWSEMVWDRWRGWSAGDPRWCTTTIDTTDREPESCAREVECWIARVRGDPRHPLRRGWSATRG